MQKATCRWHKEKPFYDLSFYVLEPKTLVGDAITVRLSYSPKSLWKLAWFLGNFGYIAKNCRNKTKSAVSTACSTIGIQIWQGSSSP